MSEIGHFRRFLGCPSNVRLRSDFRNCRSAVDDVIRRVIQAPKLARRFLRYEPGDPERDVIKPSAPEQAAGILGQPLLYSRAFHGEAQRLRNPLRLSAGDKRDAHAGFDKKVVTAPAVLQQRD